MGTGRAGAGCHGRPGGSAGALPARLRVALVGMPNVGKSALFNRLTGRYVTVSNYPGTSVEIARGAAAIAGVPAEVVDTPGMYSLLPATEEERVARSVVLEGDVGVVVHVADAKNLLRTLPLTLQLAETGRPLVLALNMADEAERLGVRADTERLARRLGIEVVPIVAVTGRGLDTLRAAIVRAAAGRAPLAPPYGDGVGRAVRALQAHLAGAYPVHPAAVAALLLQGDAEAAHAVRRAEPDGGARALARAATLAAARVAEGALGPPRATAAPWTDRVGRLLARPATGIPVLLLVLYFGLYKFVGQFGGGTVVAWLEGAVFERRVNPFFEAVFAQLPWPAVRS